MGEYQYYFRAERYKVAIRYPFWKEIAMKTALLPPYLVLAIMTSAVLAACGGGSGSPAASSPVAANPAPPPVASAPAGQSTVSGTVTGFGSVIVDGVRIDNSKVSAGKELFNGSVKEVELKLGQHVEVEHDGQFVATRARVGASAEGTVSSVNAAAGTLTVAGQAITVNTDAAMGPVTIFEGYTGLSGVQLSDRIEVHGLIKIDATGKPGLQATRIEKSGVADDTVDKVNGLVAELSTANHTFKLGSLVVDYSAAKIQPDGAVLGNGGEVTVAVPLGTVAGGAAVKASVVKVRDHKAEVGGKEFEFGGAISGLDATAKTITVAGVKIDVSAVRFDQAGKSLADLKLNAYIVVKGSYGSDSVLKAATIVLRGTEDAKDKQVELHGTVVRFTSVSSFTVRDVQVDATGVTLDPATCGTTTLANDLQVEVRGVLTASGHVKATAINCEKPGDAHVVLSREGMAANVDTTAKTFSLVTSKETITVKWSSVTLFRDVDAATLAGKKLEIEGSSSGGVFSATKIKFEGT
jgi:hypothetical protein